MKAVILAAGKGERLKGVVDSLPKPMVAVGGRPILEQNIELLRDAGITDIYINLHHLPDVIRSHFGDGSNRGVNITYSYESSIRGTAGAVRKLARHLEGQRFLVLCGDNLYRCDLAAFIGHHDSRQGLGTIGLHERQDVSQCGLVELAHDGRVTGFVEKPGGASPASSLVNAGIYVFEPGIFLHIPAQGPRDFGYDIFPLLIRRNVRLNGALLKGSLTSIDTPDSYRQAVRGCA